MGDLERRENEIVALQAIFNDGDTIEMEDNLGSGQMLIAPQVPDGYRVRKRVVDSDGHSKIMEHPVDFLPPYLLGFQLPADYPSRQPPVFTLCSKWAAKAQLSQLCHHLDRLWQDNKGDEILFAWADFLRSESLVAIGASAALDLGSSATASAEDRRAVCDAESETLAFAGVLEHDGQKRRERFDRSVVRCGMCLQDRAGAQCIRYGACMAHAFCRDCAARHLSVQITDGAVLRLTCPAGSCDAQAHPAQVKELVSADLYTKYERLMLQTTLDTMADIVYCPRPHCQCPVLREESGDQSMAACPGCSFVFCCLCKMAYHGVSPCRIKAAEMVELERLLTGGSASDRLTAERRYGKQVVRHVLEEGFAQSWIKDNCKCCPHCKSSIEKNDGCNKMTCTKCLAYFCWICGKPLPKVNPYSHYSNSKCDLFPEGWTPPDDADAAAIRLVDANDDVIAVDLDDDEDGIIFVDLLP